MAEGFNGDRLLLIQDGRKQTHVDISSYLVPGKNVIGCQVLFYGTGDGTSPLGMPGFLMKLTVDGKEIITDSKWKSFLARSWNPGQYKRWFLRALQENFDARIFPYGWNTTDFTENNEWIPAAELDGLAANHPPPIVIQITSLIYRAMLSRSSGKGLSH